MVGMVRGMIAASLLQRWGTTAANVLRLLSAAFACRNDVLVALGGVGLEDRSMTRSKAGEENGIALRGGGLAASRPRKSFGANPFWSAVRRR